MVPSSSPSFPCETHKLDAFHDMLQPNADTRALTLLDGIVQSIPYISASWDYVAFICQFLVDSSEVELVSAPFCVPGLSSPNCQSLQSASPRAPSPIGNLVFIAMILHSFASLTRHHSHEHQDISPPIPLTLSDSQ